MFAITAVLLEYMSVLTPSTVVAVSVTHALVAGGTLALLCNA
jgi:hypothetical protein